MTAKVSPLRAKISWGKVEVEDVEEEKEEHKESGARIGVALRRAEV